MKKAITTALTLCFFCGVTVRDHGPQWLNWWQGSNLTEWVLPSVVGYERFLENYIR